MLIHYNSQALILSYLINRSRDFFRSTWIKPLWWTSKWKKYPAYMDTLLSDSTNWWTLFYRIPNPSIFKGVFLHVLIAICVNFAKHVIGICTLYAIIEQFVFVTLNMYILKDPSFTPSITVKGYYTARWNQAVAYLWSIILFCLLQNMEQFRCILIITHKSHTNILKQMWIKCPIGYTIKTSAAV